MMYGYARVSTTDQSLDMQLDALKLAGCEIIFSEKISANRKHRPQFKKLLSVLEKGDKICVYKLDRLGRSVIDLVQIVHHFEKSEIGFCSVMDHIDTTSASGKLIFHVLCSVAEFERSLISERTKDGIQAAQKRGVIVGRPKGMITQTQLKIEACKKLIDQNITVAQACHKIGLSRTTFYRYRSL